MKAKKEKAEESKRPPINWAAWADRVMIVTLGLTLGLCAKWVRRTWDANAAAKSPPSSSAPESPTPDEKSSN